MRRGLPILAGLLAGSVAGAGELRGRTLVDGEPVPGVEIRAVALESPRAAALREAEGAPAPAPIATGESDAEGRFAISLPDGAADLARLEFAGPVVPIRLERVFPVGETEDLGEVTLAEPSALAGQVLDARGGPVVGATVTLWGGWFAGRGGVSSLRSTPLPQTTTTDVDGRFRFDRAAETNNRLRIEALAFGLVELRSQRGAPLRAPVVLRPGRDVTGTVFGQDGRTPAPGALVRFEGDAESRWVRARSDGTFALSGLPDRPGVLVADAGDAGRGSTPAPAGQTQATIALAPTALLQGVVVEAATADPVAGVRVVARAREGSYVAVSGADGRYRITGLAGGECALSADHAGFVPWSREGIRLAAGEAEGLDVALTRGAAVAGRVTDEQGAPVAGAAGHVVRRGGTGVDVFKQFVAGSGTFETDAEGRFVVRRLEPGPNQTLSVRHEDHQPETLAGLELTPGETLSGIDVVLRRGLVLRGVVVDPDARPVPDAQVRLTRSRSNLGGGGFFFTPWGRAFAPGEESTDVEGRFEVRGIAPGPYQLSVTKRSYVTARLDEVEVTEEGIAEPLEVTLVPGASISGVLTTTTGSPAPGLRVMALPAAGDEPTPVPGSRERFRSEEVSGPGGEFVVEGLSVGEAYDVEVLLYGAPTPGAQGVKAPADGLRLSVPDSGGIHGRVMDDRGDPVTDFLLSYRHGPNQNLRVFFGGDESKRGFGQNAVAVHSPEGRFSLDDVGPGEWIVEVRAEGFQKGSTTAVVAEGALTEGVEVRLPRGRVVRGRVVGGNGAPVPDALVKATLSGRQMWVFDPFGTPENADHSDADGRFEIRGLAPGAYTVEASHSAWSAASTSVELAEAPVEVELRLDEGAEVAGIVVSSGGPVPGASVSLKLAGQPQFMGDWQARSATADAGGRFRFDRLAPGRYALQASEGSRSSESVEAVVAANGAAAPVTLNLGGGTRVLGRVLGLPEPALVGLDVSAWNREGFRTHTQTGTGGSFELTGVPPGVLGVSVRLGDYLRSTRTEQVDVEIAQGQLEATVELRFDEGVSVTGQVTRGGEPVPDARIYASPESGGGQWMNARADAAGSYVLDGLREGSYVFNVSSSVGNLRRRNVEVRSGMTLDLEIPVARLQGRVVDASTLQPLGEVQVSAQLGDDWAGGAISDSSGAFTIEGLEDGRVHSVRFQKPAYQSETRELTATAHDEVSVELRRGQGLQVVARDGIYATPLRSLGVEVTDAGGRFAYGEYISLDSEGRGEIASLAPGSYSLRVWADGYAPLDLGPLTVPAASLAVSLTPGGSLLIRVGSQTLARSGATAHLHRSDGTTYGLYGSGGKIRLGQPIVHYGNVAPGAYTLVTDAGERLALQVAEGGHSELTLP